MGKTTLYHPIPLSVIRGAAEYHGWKFGTIKQEEAYPTGKWAKYVARIVMMPDSVIDRSYETKLVELRSCFMDDIQCHWLRQTKSGYYYVTLIVDVMDRPDGELVPMNESERLELQEGRNE